MLQKHKTQKTQMWRNQQKTNKQRDWLWVNLMNTCPAPISHHIKTNNNCLAICIKNMKPFFKTIFVTLFFYVN